MKQSACKIVGFGDSITLGAKASQDQYNWLSVMAQLFTLFYPSDVEVVNQGVGDNTISPRTTNYEEATKPSALERVEDDGVALQPNVVLVCFGLNDMRFGTPVEIFTEDLEKVLNKIRVALPDATVFLTNVFHMTGWDRYEPRNRGSIGLTKQYNQAIDALGKKHGIPVADVSSAMGFRDHLIHEDGVHGNDLAHRLIGNKVFETIALHVEWLIGELGDR